MRICSSYDWGGDNDELLFGRISIFLSMSVILTPLVGSVWCRRYRAVDNPAIPPPRMITCSHFSVELSSDLLAWFLTPLDSDDDAATFL